MSEKETKKPKVNKAKWTKVQVIGLWVLVIGSLLFWSGVYMGNQAARNEQTETAKVKTQAVEEYKATLKN